METWDYNKPEHYQHASQEDWNQTIVIKFNYLASSLQLNTNELRRLVVPIHLKPLIESLHHYSKLY